MSRHPYQDKPARAFWRSAVAGRGPEQIADWYRPKFDIAGMKIATAGSCFAQHIGRALKLAGYPFIDMEPPPAGLARETWPAFGYGIYSARYGNVFTSRQMLQLFKRAHGLFAPRLSAWAHRGGYVDPFRPAIEPEPFESVDELEHNRSAHLERVAAVFSAADLLIFTLGLTECWCTVSDGAALPLAPGVAGGSYHPDAYRFCNLTVSEVVSDMEELLALARGVNPALRLVLTVSPVPLAATASDEHVVVATSHSKAILRAACGELVSRHDSVDYFPAFEIISSTPMRGAFYEPDGRNVTAQGVAHVMRQFLAAHPPSGAAAAAVEDIEKSMIEAACEDELLAAAGRQ